MVNLAPGHHDTFRTAWRNPALREKFVWFSLDLNGQPGPLNVEFAPRPMLPQAGTYSLNYARTVSLHRPAKPHGLAGGGS